MVFITTVIFSPVEFRFLWFIVSFLLTGGGLERLLNRARRQKVKVGRATALDIAGSKQPKRS